MSDRDPGPMQPASAVARAEAARATLRRRVANPAAKTADLAPGPMLDKSAYIDLARFEAEQRNLFLGQPIVAGLSGDIPEPGDFLLFDAADHLGAFGDQLALLELHRAVPVKKGVLTASSNWKFALDTFGEGYHFATLHASTIGQTHFNDRAVFEPFGRHHRIGFPDKSVGALVGKAESEWPQTEDAGVHYLFPNTVIVFGSLTPGVVFTQVFRLFPDGVGGTRCQFAVYAPFGIASDDYRQTVEMAHDATAHLVETEDYRVASAGYANLLTAPDGFRTVLGANEIALQAVQKHRSQAIGMPL
jgi:phenylpropionate dioxygenase-like ring-hydroxylating dioxygenase large terminal subunit